MENILGRKQSIKNEDWLAAVGRIEELVSRAELDRLVEDTIKEIRRQTDGKRLLMLGPVEKTAWYLERYAKRQALQNV